MKKPDSVCSHSHDLDLDSAIKTYKAYVVVVFKESPDFSTIWRLSDKNQIPGVGVIKALQISKWRIWL